MLYTLRQIKSNLMGILEMGLGEFENMVGFDSKPETLKSIVEVPKKTDEQNLEIKRTTNDFTEIKKSVKEEAQEKVKVFHKEMETTQGLIEQASDFGTEFENQILKQFENVNIKSFLRLISSGVDLSALVKKIKEGEEDEDMYAVDTSTYDDFRQLGYIPDNVFGATEHKSLKTLLLIIEENQEIKIKFKEIYDDYYTKGLVIREYRNFKDFKGPTITLGNIGELRKLSKSNFTPNLLINMIEKVSPEVQKKYLENINSLGGTPFKIGEFYDQANRLLGVRTATESTYNEVFLNKGETIKERALEIRKIYEVTDQKATEVIVKVKQQISESLTLTQEQKEKYLDNLEKSTSDITGEIRKVGQGFFANVGKGLNSAGVGVTFETFIKGLNLSLGVGTDGKTVLPGVVLSYKNGVTIAETDKSIIKANAEIGVAGNIVGVIPFAGTSLSLSNKIGVLDNSGNVTEHTVSLKGTIGGGVLMYSNMENIAGGIEQKEAKLNSTMFDIANAKNETEIKNIIKTNITSSSVDNKISEKIILLEQGRWFKLIQNNYKADGISDNSDFATKLASLESTVANEINKMNKDYVNRTKDESDFSGFGIGAASMLGIFIAPVGGITFTSREMSIEDGKKTTYNGDIGKTLITGEDTKTSQVESGTDLSREDGVDIKDTKFLANFILNARTNNEFREFQKAKIDNNEDNTKALKHLEKYLKATKKSPESKEISRLLEANKNDKNKLNNLLEKINSLTSGSIMTRGLGNSTDKQSYLTQKKGEIEKELKGLTNSALDKYKGIGIDTEISKAYSFEKYSELVLKTPETITKSHFGAVDYSQKLGKARGLDGAAVDMPVIKASEGKPITVEAARVLLTENDLYKNNIKIKLGILADENLYKFMAGQEITNNKGEKIKVKEVPKYYFGLAAVDGATCTNGVVYADVPSVEIQKTITTNGKSVTTNEKVQLEDYSANSVDYYDDNTTIGISGVSKPENSNNTIDKSHIGGTGNEMIAESFNTANIPGTSVTNSASNGGTSGGFTPN